MPMEDDNKPQRDKKPSLFQVIASVLSAGFGVQNSKNRERDFKHGSHRTFIIAGIIFTVVFVATVFGVVQLVLSKAGA